MTTALVLPPSFAPTNPTTIPTLRTLGLSDSEKNLVDRLQAKLTETTRELHLLDAYYNGIYRMTTLGISLPPELAGLRTAVGWPMLAVDPLHDRLAIEGFRYPDSEDADDAMWEVWKHNALDEEAPLGFLDALVHGRSHIVVGSNEDSDVPLVTIESAYNLAYLWDSRKRAVRAALHFYTADDEPRATLMLPDQTIDLARDSLNSPWRVDGRDEHRVGWTPCLPMVNRARVHDREGKSEITPIIRGYTDAACRAMLRMEVGAEFFSTPQRYLVGASMQDFQDAEGNPKTAWETYIGRWLMLEHNDNGEKPEIGQFTAQDPGAHTRILDYYAERVAEETGLPPTYLGKTTDNPASADAIRMSTDRLVKKAESKHLAFKGGIEGAMRAAMAFRQGDIPDQAQLIETIWRRPEIPTPAATTDAVSKQILAGYLPAVSDVTGEALGYSPMQRARIERDRKRSNANEAVGAILQRVSGAATARTATAPTNPSTVPGTPGVSPERASGDQHQPQ